MTKLQTLRALINKTMTSIARVGHYTFVLLMMIVEKVKEDG